LGLKGREGKEKPGSPGPKIEMPNEAANMGWGDSNSLSLSQRTKVERNALAFSNPVV